jgi:hypothetical protein
MTSTLHLSPAWSVLYCRMHQRMWSEAGNDWVACVASPRDIQTVTEAACDICIGDALTTFRGFVTLLTLLPPP